MTHPQPNDAFAWTQEPWGRALRCLRLPAAHLFTSRDLILRDSQAEWAAAAASLGVPAERLLLVRQVHGVQVAVARHGPENWPRPEADILISDDRSVGIGVLVADCAPVLLFDRARNVVGAAHAGWRGAAADAAGAAVRALQAEFGSRPGDVIAAIGPCLGRCCGEVGPDVVDAFRARGADAAAIDAWFTRGSGDRFFLDLERANREQLERAGVDPHAIFASGLCTRTHRDHLHSYRAEGRGAGRLLGAIRPRVSG